MEDKHSASMTIKSVTVSPSKAAIGGSCGAEQPALSRSSCAWAGSYTLAQAGDMNCSVD